MKKQIKVLIRLKKHLAELEYRLSILRWPSVDSEEFEKQLKNQVNSLESDDYSSQYTSLVSILIEAERVKDLCLVKQKDLERFESLNQIRNKKVFDNYLNNLVKEVNNDAQEKGITRKHYV